MSPYQEPKMLYSELALESSHDDGVETSFGTQLLFEDTEETLSWLEEDGDWCEENPSQDVLDYEEAQKDLPPHVMRVETTPEDEEPDRETHPGYITVHFMNAEAARECKERWRRDHPDSL